MSQRHITILLGGLLLLGVACSQPVKTKVTIESGLTSVGNEFTLAVRIDEDTPVERLYGACFDMIIDTSKMAISGALSTSASIAGSMIPSPRYKTQSYRNGQTDRVVFCISREGPITGIDGSGEIARFTFMGGPGTGDAEVSFSDDYLVLDDESQRAVEMEPVTITITN